MSSSTCNNVKTPKNRWKDDNESKGDSQEYLQRGEDVGCEDWRLKDKLIFIMVIDLRWLL